MIKIAGSIKGITIEIGGNTTKLQEALKKVNNTSKDLTKELQQIEKSLKFNPGNVELLAQKQRALSEAVANTSEKLKILKEAQEQAAAALAKGEIGKDQYDALTREVLKAENQLEKYKNQLSSISEEELAAAKASEERRSKLAGLASEQEKLKESAEKLAASYELQVASLGNNAKESDKLKARQEYLSQAMENTAKQTENLEKQLELAKEEYGANSSEVNKLEKELLETKTAAQQFANEFANVGSTLQQTSDKFAKASEGLNKVGNALTLGLTAPIVLGAGLATKAASDFESAFAGVKKTVDEAVDSNGKVTISYADLEKGIRNMAKELPKSASEIAGVAEAAGQLGIETENVLSFTETMIAMGEATDMSAETAAVSLAKLANITGMSQDDFDKLGSSIVDLGNNFATTESAIVEMGLRLAGTGTVVGLTEDQIMAMAAAMSSVGINAEAGGSAMSRVMQKINTEVASGGANLESFAATAGMSAEEFANYWREEPADAILEFVKGLDDINKAGGDVTSVLKELGISSTTEIDTMLRLAGANGVLAESLETSAGAWEENTALTEEAEKRYETFESQLQMFKNQVTDIAISIGTPLLAAAKSILEALTPLLEKVGELAQSFADADPKVQKFILGFVGILAAIGPVLKILGLFAGVASVVTNALAILSTGATATGTAALVLSKVIGGLSTVFSGIVGVVGAVATALGLPVAAVVALGVAIAGLVVLVVQHWDTIKEKTVEVFESIKETLTSVGEWFSQVWESISNSTSEFFDGLKEKVSEAMETVSNVIETAILFIAEIFNLAVELLLLPWSFIWENLKAYIIPIWDSIKETVSNAINAVKETVSTTLEVIKIKFSEVWENIKSKVSEVWESIKAKTSETWNGIKSTLYPIVEGIKNKITEVWNGIKSTVTEVWNNIKSSTTEAWNSVKATVTNVITGIKDSISSGLSSAKDTALNKFNEIKSGVEEKINAAKNAVKTAIDTMKGYFNFTWSLPKIKLPHLSVSGSFSLNPPSVPKFSISWYKDGAIFKNPTLFNTPYGMKGVGEAGPEAVLPIEKLSGIMADTLKELGFEKHNNNAEIIKALEGMTKPININIDSHALIRLIAPLMSEQLNFMNKRQLKGEGLG